MKQKLVLAILLTILFSAELMAQEGGYYPMYCRGPFTMIGSITAGSEIKLIINKHTEKAINNGKNLPEGTCAWSDRPISAKEPDLIAIRTSYSTGIPLDPDHPSSAPVLFAHHYTNPALDAALANCLFNSRCVVKTDIKHDPRNKRFVNNSDDGHIWLMWPKFAK